MLLLAVVTAQAQNAAVAAFKSAEEAYNNGNYRNAITKLTEAEQLLGKTNVRILWLKTMSYYKSQDYEKCVSSADSYFAMNPAQDEAYTEIRSAKSNAQTKIREAAEAERARLAAAEAERKRKEDAARAQAAHEKEASDKWSEIKNSNELSVLQSFLSKYGDTPSKAAAQTRYNNLRAAAEWERIKDTENEETLNAFMRNHSGTPSVSLAQERLTKVKGTNRYKQLEVDLAKYQKWRSANITKSVVWGTVGAAALAGGAYALTLKDDEGEMNLVLALPLATVGFGVGIGGLIKAFGYNFYSSDISRIKNEMNKLRPTLSVQLQPAVMPIDPLGHHFAGNNMAYGLRLSVTF